MENSNVYSMIIHKASHHILKPKIGVFLIWHRSYVIPRVGPERSPLFSHILADLGDGISILYCSTPTLRCLTSVRARVTLSHGPVVRVVSPILWDALTRNRFEAVCLGGRTTTILEVKGHCSQTPPEQETLKLL